MAASEEAREGVKDAALEWLDNQHRLADYQRALAIAKQNTPEARSLAPNLPSLAECEDVLAALGDFRAYLEAWELPEKCRVELVFSSAHIDGRKHCLNHNTYYSREESCPNGR